MHYPLTNRHDCEPPALKAGRKLLTSGLNSLFLTVKDSVQFTIDR
jgi:hypothetical protein